MVANAIPNNTRAGKTTFLRAILNLKKKHENRHPHIISEMKITPEMVVTKARVLILSISKKKCSLHNVDFNQINTHADITTVVYEPCDRSGLMCTHVKAVIIRKSQL